MSPGGEITVSRIGGIVVQQEGDGHTVQGSLGGFAVRWSGPPWAEGPVGPMGEVTQAELDAAVAAEATVRAAADTSHTADTTSVHGIADTSVLALKSDLVFNVKDAAYGAVGNGVADDTAEIQAAIDACNAAGGGNVFFPKGTYLISTALSIPNFVNLIGAGQSTILRCSGNNYAINFNPANRVSVSSLQIDASSVQSSGGGFDFTNAGFNIRIDDIYLGNNLFTSFNIKPAASKGHYVVSRVKWNGVTGCTNGILLGDGTNLVADVSFDHILGRASTAADMTNWLIAKNNVDSLIMEDVTFYAGGTGCVFGEVATGTVSGLKMTDCIMDTMTNQGYDFSKVRGAVLTSCDVQTCGTSSLAALNIALSCRGFTMNGGVVQGNRGDGIDIQNGALYTTISDVNVSDNNTGNTASRFGIGVAANTTRFKILGCTSGNNMLLTTGHQKYGISVATGTSDYYQIIGNQLLGNETSNSVSDGGSGTNKYLAGNL